MPPAATQTGFKHQWHICNVMNLPGSNFCIHFYQWNLPFVDVKGCLPWKLSLHLNEGVKTVKQWALSFCHGSSRVAKILHIMDPVVLGADLHGLVLSANVRPANYDVPYLPPVLIKLIPPGEGLSSLELDIPPCIISAVQTCHSKIHKHFRMTQSICPLRAKYTNGKQMWK